MIFQTDGFQPEAFQSSEEAAPVAVVAVTPSGLNTAIDTAGGYLVPQGGATDYWWPDAKRFPLVGMATIHPIRCVASLARIVAKVAVYAHAERIDASAVSGRVLAIGGRGARGMVRSATSIAWTRPVAATGIRNPIREMIVAWMLDEAA